MVKKQKNSFWPEENDPFGASEKALNVVDHRGFKKQDLLDERLKLGQQSFWLHTEGHQIFYQIVKSENSK
ncbi:MAG: hypothetical protein LBP22_08995 [Deltaproteobacteria bacterium]|jgi:hypothetical protein|nr:hypothetical protein [Deltaproteobacteria bacterium]